MNNDCDDRIKRIKDKEETVRKLKMVKLHRTKHDATELGKLIDQWQGVCQQALQDLAEKLKQHQSSDSAESFSMQKLLEHMNIEPELVGYSVDEDCFVEPPSLK